MAGGRPPKPTAILSIEGGLRKGRHNERDREPTPAGSAQMVVPLAGEALAFWDYEVPRLIEIGLATELDSYELCLMCEWYAEYRKWADMVGTAKKPINDYRRMTGMAAASKQFLGIAAKFGLNPTDRVGLQSNAPTKADGVLELINRAQ